MQPRLTLVTLGVADVARSRAFYERMGFTASSASNPQVTFLDAGGLVLALWSRSDLAADAGIRDDGSGFAGISLAHNVGSPAEVDRVLAEAAQAGATPVKPGHATFWGGYSGYFGDPDGYLWEVAHNPFWPIDVEGRLVLP